MNLRGSSIMYEIHSTDDFRSLLVRDISAQSLPWLLAELRKLWPDAAARQV